MDRWIVVADSPFLPAHGGGEREHVGFVRAAASADLLAALVIPTSEALDERVYAEVIGDVPLVEAPRREKPWLLLHPTVPYVVSSRPVPPDLVERVRRVAGSVTGVVCFSYKAHRIGRALSSALEVPVVLRQHNREGDYHRSLAREATGLRRLVLAVEARRIARDEAAVDRASWLSATADISLVDAEARRASGGRNVHYVPPFSRSATPSAPWPASRAAGPGHVVVFVGALDVATNRAGLRWFTEQVWPRIRAEVPDARLEVVGRRPPHSVHRALAAIPGCRLHGDVPAVEDFLRSADVAVNPAVTGSGVNIKLLDYLQSRLPVVSTPLGVAGLPLEAGVHVEVAAQPTAFASSVVALLRDGARRRRLGEAGHEHITSLLEPRANLARLAALLPPPAIRRRS